MMEYICYKRYRGPSYNGDAVVRYGEKLYAINYAVFLNSRMFGYTTSQVCYDHFSRNDDGLGLQRGKLITEIREILNKHSDRWPKIVTNLKLQQFRRLEHKDVFVWNFKFYNAEIEDLQYIHKLIK